MYFLVFAPTLEDKKVINEINFFVFSRLIKKDPSVESVLSKPTSWTEMPLSVSKLIILSLWYLEVVGEGTVVFPTLSL